MSTRPHNPSPGTRMSVGASALTAGVAITAVAAGLKAAGWLPGSVPPSPVALAREALAGIEAAGTGGNPVPIFTDIAGTAGIDFVHDNAMHGQFRLPEQIGPGAGVLDFDGDGDL